MAKESTTTAAPAPETEKPARKWRLPSTRLSNPGHSWCGHEARITPETPIEALLNGAFWRLVSVRIRRGDHIRWRDDALLRFGELVVVAHDPGTGAMDLRSLWSTEVAAVEARGSENADFYVKDLGIHDGWAIFRTADHHQMVKNCSSYDDAMRRIRTDLIPQPIVGRVA